MTKPTQTPTSAPREQSLLAASDYQLERQTQTQATARQLEDLKKIIQSHTLRQH